MMWTLLIAFGITQLAALLLVAGVFRAASRADRWLESAQAGRSA